MQPNQNKHQSISVKMNKAYYDQLKSWSSLTGITVTWMVNKAISEFIKKGKP